MFRKTPVGIPVLRAFLFLVVWSGPDLRKRCPRATGYPELDLPVAPVYCASLPFVSDNAIRRREYEQEYWYSLNQDGLGDFVASLRDQDPGAPRMSGIVSLRDRTGIFSIIRNNPGPLS